MSSAQAAPVPRIVPDRLPAHPRLFARQETWDRVRQDLNSANGDRPLRTVFHALKTQADQWLSAPPLTRVMTGKRLLGVSRDALFRISTLAAIARLTQAPAYRDRAIQELEAVVSFSDWNPSHFLDVGEMAVAVAIGYDWLYDDLSDELRLKIENALLDKAIQPSFVEGGDTWWIQSENNWNQVCHAGLSVAALAIGDKHPEIANTIIERALENLPHVAKAYAPDGAYQEGPMYWSYGTSYHVILADALLQATGDTHGVDAYPGFLESADYLQQMTGPSGLFFNYGDCRSQRGLQLPLFWMAARCQRPDWIARDLSQLDSLLTDLHTEHYRLLALFLFWYQPTTPTTQPPLPAESWVGRGLNPVVVLRSAADSLYFAMKGGSPSDSHAHMDSGTFVLESDGIRWALDLGLQEYQSLEGIGLNIWGQGQDIDRWRVFRIGCESHNILRFNDAPPRVDGRAHLTNFSAESRLAIYDLGEVYRDQVRGVQRGARILENSLLLQDEWQTGPQGASVTWQLLTDAEVEPNAEGWLLRQDEQQLTIRILNSEQAILSQTSAETLVQPYDAPNPGAQRLSVTVKTDADARGHLSILFTPGVSAQASPPLRWKPGSRGLSRHKKKGPPPGRSLFEKANIRRFPERRACPVERRRCG